MNSDCKWCAVDNDPFWSRCMGNTTFSSPACASYAGVILNSCP
jgi:hypothetical protein